jgi:cation diffusion facilitator family transporter
MTTPPVLTPEQRAKERSIQTGLMLDYSILSLLIVIGVIGGSLTIIAEAIRGTLMNAIEAFSLIVLRRIHRGRLAALEFGTGKLEQIANLLIAFGMLGSAVWIVLSAVETITGDRQEGAPIGLAAAAIAGAVNVYINLVAWDGVRRAAEGDSSFIMQGQLSARVVKLMSSIVVQVTLTVAAVTTDAVIARWADALGSLLVTGVICRTAMGLLRAGIPDIIDRGLDQAARGAIERALARHREDYDRLDRLRSRRSGETLFIELALAFNPALSLFEVSRRIEGVRAAILQEVGAADIAIAIAADGV